MHVCVHVCTCTYIVWSMVANALKHWNLLQEYDHTSPRTESAHQIRELLCQAQEHISRGGAAQHSDQLSADVVQGAQ